MKKIAYLIMVLSAIFFCAQNVEAKTTLESMAEIEGVEYVYISKSMLGSVDILDAYNLGEVAGTLTSLEILSCDMVESENELNLIRKKLESIAKDMELMSKIKEDGESVAIYIQNNGNVMTQLLLIEDAVEEITVICLKGKIKEEALKSLTYF